jgi:hypothetical protein
MKGKYITTSLMLAVLAGSKECPSVLVDETCASVNDHLMIWMKEQANLMQQTADRDELKTA